MKRLLLVAALVSASCAGASPSAPTDVRAGFSQSVEPSEAPSPQVATLDPTNEDLDATIEDVDATIEDIDSTFEDIDPAAAAKTFTLTGVVTDKAYAAWKISTATVTAGSTSVKTNAQGRYTLRLRAGAYAVKILKTGYTTSSIRKSVSANTTANVPLAPAKPSRATARCKDRTWSFSQNRSGTCSSHKGVAYWVCPGKLCR
jgi:hypothetical protein